MFEFIISTFYMCLDIPLLQRWFYVLFYVFSFFFFNLIYQMDDLDKD